jgi:hypothetical protein
MWSASRAVSARAHTTVDSSAQRSTWRLRACRSRCTSSGISRCSTPTSRPRETPTRSVDSRMRSGPRMRSWSRRPNTTAASRACSRTRSTGPHGRPGIPCSRTSRLRSSVHRRAAAGPPVPRRTCGMVSATRTDSSCRSRRSWSRLPPRASTRQATCTTTRRRVRSATYSSPSQNGSAAARGPRPSRVTCRPHQFSGIYVRARA